LICERCLEGLFVRWWSRVRLNEIIE
jgi:hypothetical protein